MYEAENTLPGYFSHHVAPRITILVGRDASKNWRAAAALADLADQHPVLSKIWITRDHGHDVAVYHDWTDEKMHWEACYNLFCGKIRDSNQFYRRIIITTCQEPEQWFQTEEGPARTRMFRYLSIADILRVDDDTGDTAPYTPLGMRLSEEQAKLVVMIKSMISALAANESATTKSPPSVLMVMYRASKNPLEVPGFTTAVTHSFVGGTYVMVGSQPLRYARDIADKHGWQVHSTTKKYRDGGPRAFLNVYDGFCDLATSAVAFSSAPRLIVIACKFEGTSEEYAAAHGPAGPELFKFSDHANQRVDVPSVPHGSKFEAVTMKHIGADVEPWTFGNNVD